MILGDSNTISQEEVANTFGVPLTAVGLLENPKYRRALQPFLWLTDIYLWTCKSHYSTYQDKYTFIQIKNVSEINTMFLLKYADKIRLAITADKLGIFKNEELLRKAKRISNRFFNEERIAALAPLIEQLETTNEYKILITQEHSNDS